MQTLDIRDTNSLDSHKLNIIQWITSLDDFAIIEKLEQIKNRYILDRNVEIDGINEIQATAVSEQERQSILQGLSEIQQGQGIPHDEVRVIYEKWL